MNENGVISLFFPTVVYEKNSNDLLNEEIVKKSREICEQYGENSFITNCSTTVSSFSNVLDLPEYKNIKDYIIKSVSDYISFMKFDSTREYKISGSWLNYYAPGDLQELHIHHDSMVSGCFYIIANDEYDFYIRSPQYNQQAMLPFNEVETEFNQTTHKILTSPEKLLIFMSSTLHGTIQSNKERLTLSFNITH